MILKAKIAVLFILSFLFQCCMLNAQEELEIVGDSIIVEQNAQEMSPIHKQAFKAAWHSALLPGWGQINNKQVWKTSVYLPLIAGGLGIGIGINPKYQKFNNILENRLQGDTTDVYWGRLNDFQLRTRIKNLKRSRNLGFALAGSAYAIQIMDAYVYSVIMQKEQGHSPSRAAFLSAMVPGLGQVYNKKYWKLPIVYGALGLAGYFVFDNASKHKAFKEAYINFGEEGFVPDPITIGFTQDGLLNARKVYQRNLEVSSIVMGALYIANILDAVVDAHLFDFDVSDELSIRTMPNIGYRTYGATISFNF